MFTCSIRCTTTWLFLVTDGSFCVCTCVCSCVYAWGGLRIARGLNKRRWVAALTGQGNIGLSCKHDISQTINWNWHSSTNLPDPRSFCSLEDFPCQKYFWSWILILVVLCHLEFGKEFGIRVRSSSTVGLRPRFKVCGWLFWLGIKSSC